MDYNIVLGYYKNIIENLKGFPVFLNNDNYLAEMISCYSKRRFKEQLSILEREQHHFIEYPQEYQAVIDSVNEYIEDRSFFSYKGSEIREKRGMYPQFN